MPGNGYDSIWLLSQRATNSTHTHTDRHTTCGICHGVCACVFALFACSSYSHWNWLMPPAPQATHKHPKGNLCNALNFRTLKVRDIVWSDIWQRQCQWMRSATVCMREQGSRTEIVQSLAKELWQLSNCFENEFMVVISFSMDNQCTVG